MPASKSADQWFQEYGESHQNKINKFIHWIMVPTIFFTVIGLLWDIPKMPWMEGSIWINWATITLIPVFYFYFRMSIAIMLGMLIYTLLCLVLAYWLSTSVDVPLWLLSLVLFAIAWIFQFIGHKIEGKKPSFLKDLQFLLVGPAWLMGFIYRNLGIKY